MSSRHAVVSASLWAMCAGDAMAMPVHWYYCVDHIKAQFGSWISDFNAPKASHPSSIMSLSNTSGSGRSSVSSQKDPEVIGSIILHDKLHLWNDPRGTIHYHQGLEAGDNTLNVLVALRAGVVLVQGRSEVWTREARGAVLKDYVDFMRTPGSHKDSYAESWHRDFFKDWSQTRPTTMDQVLDFAESRSQMKFKSRKFDSQLDAIGCLPMILPFVLLSAPANQERAVQAAMDMVRLTHPHPNALRTVELFSRALHAVVGGACLQLESEHALKALNQWETCIRYSKQASRFPLASEQRLKVHQRAVGELGLACYSSGALSSLFYLAHEFHDDPVGGVITNTNCGGENCSRGAALGALLGASAANKNQTFPDQTWTRALRDAQNLVPKILQGLNLE